MDTTKFSTLADAIRSVVSSSKDNSFEAAAGRAGISFRSLQYLMSGTTRKLHGRTVKGLAKLLRSSEDEVRRLAGCSK